MFQSVRVAAGAWLLAIYDRQFWKKQVKSTKSLFFFQDGTWRQVATSRCRWLQSVAATCSHLLRQPLGSHLAATWQPLAATRRHLPQVVAANGCQVAAKWLPSGCLSKWLQVADISKIKMMHVCSLSEQSGFVGRKQGWDEAFAGSRWQRAFQPCLAAMGNPCPCLRVGNPHGNHHPSLDNYHCHC